jgi:thiol-disulfide isomerase/thioredoxin
LKKILFFLLFVINTAELFAQTDTTNNYVNHFTTLPAFNIVSIPDSTAFTNEKLKKNAPLVIMFFSPDCDHCQNETKELLAYKKELKDIPILMISVAPYQEIKAFYELFNLSAISNVKLGQDVHFKLGSIYKLRTYPSIFIYDRKGILAKAFVGNIGIPAILDALN